MLKRLAFAVFLTIVLPISGEQQSSKPDSNQPNGNGGTNPAPPTSRMVTCEVKQEGTTIECQWPEAVPKGYFKRLFSAENTPNIALFFVGLGGIVVAVFTLRIIRRQADVMETQANEMALQHGEMEKQAGYMKDQTKILRGSVAVAQTSADAAMAQIRLMKNKERGRLRIEFDKPELVNDPDPDNGYELPFRLILDGTTQVYITESSCFIGIHDSGDPVGDPWWNSMGVPETITPENRIYKGTATILTGEKPWGEPITGVDEARVALVREGKLHVFARGYILYEDIFDGSWEVRFNHRWQYGHNFYTFDGIDLSGGSWVSIGDNGEYRIESIDPTDPNDEPWDNQSQ